jgi:hypothetical protein
MRDATLTTQAILSHGRLQCLIASPVTSLICLEEYESTGGPPKRA